MNAAYSMGASYGQVIRHVILPSALPEIRVGMRIAVGIVACLFDLPMRWIVRRVVPWQVRN